MIRTMDSDWFAALVIILSAVLAIFLLLSIALVIKLIQIANTAKKITDQAEAVADKAEYIADFFKKSAGPLALFKFMTNISDTFHKKSRRGKEK